MVSIEQSALTNPDREVMKRRPGLTNLARSARSGWSLGVCSSRAAANAVENLGGVSLAAAIKGVECLPDRRKRLGDFPVRGRGRRALSPAGPLLRRRIGAGGPGARGVVGHHAGAARPVRDRASAAGGRRTRSRRPRSAIGRPSSTGSCSWTRASARGRPGRPCWSRRRPASRCRRRRGRRAVGPDDHPGHPDRLILDGRDRRAGRPRRSDPADRAGRAGTALGRARRVRRRRAARRGPGSALRDLPRSGCPGPGRPASIAIDDARNLRRGQAR